MIKKPDPIEPGKHDDILVLPAYHYLQKKFKPLDFFCTQGAGFIGWGIRQVTKNMSPDRECEYNHAGLLPDGSSCTLEALWHVESKNIFTHYEGCNVLIGRYLNLTEENYYKAIKSIQRHIDQPYPKRRLVLHLLNLAHFVHWINAVVCSELVAKALYYAGARGHHYWGTTPDNLADEIHHELNANRDGPKYEIVFEGKLSWLLYKYCKRCMSVHLVPAETKKCTICNVTTYDPIGFIPSKKLRELTKKYNEKKVLWINEQLIK